VNKNEETSTGIAADDNSSPMARYEWLVAAYEALAANIAERLKAGALATDAQTLEAERLRSELNHVRHAAWFQALGTKPLPLAILLDETPSGLPIVMAPPTLGDILYADKTHELVLEEDWVALVRCIAARDFRALHDLYDRTHRLVFTLITRITDSRGPAEELALDVFRDVWRLSSTYDSTAESVLGWVMKQARLRALEWLELDHPGRNRVASQSDMTAEVLSPSASLLERLAQHVSQETRAATHRWAEPDWNDVSPGISCKLLAIDTPKDRVSMLVRLMPGVEYPPHRHAGVEELYLLHGELWIDDRKVCAGDYHRAEPGSSDDRVWSETGCMCVLMTSTRDLLR
jgi:anti-sigma factor ChrR (cupin superfamily)